VIPVTDEIGFNGDLLRRTVQGDLRMRVQLKLAFPGGTRSENIERTNGQTETDTYIHTHRVTLSPVTSGALTVTFQRFRFW